MNIAIIFISNDEQRLLAKAPYRGSNLLLYQINKLRRVDVSKIYVIGNDFEVPGAIKRNSVDEIISEVTDCDKALLVSPFYPAISVDDYNKLLQKDTAVLTYNNDVCSTFVLPFSRIKEYEKLQYEQVPITNKEVRKFTTKDAHANKETSLKDVAVISLSSSVDLVNEICSYLDIEPGKVNVAHFADGETLVELGETVRGKKVYVVQSTSRPVNETLMELLICLDALRRSSAAEITCVIPYFGYARQDRKASPRQPITAKLVAAMLELAGANRVVTFDLHAAQIQGFFHCPVDDLTTVPMIGQYFLNKNFDPENTVVVSPDHGGVKRARNLAEILEMPLAIIDKRRPRANVCEAMNIIGDVKDKTAIVVDDICDTGGSLVAACQILKDNGAKDVYVAITHGIFSHNGVQRIQDSSIKELVVTNTIKIPDEEAKACPKITILSVGWMLSKLILAVSGHTPVSDVYALYERKN